MIHTRSDGFCYAPEFFSRDAQEAALAALRAIVGAAPFYQPVMPRSGRPMSVKMTNAGTLGWVTDKQRGYRYQPTHPITGAEWPAIPPIFLSLWDAVTDGYPASPEACLVNWYQSESSKMGLHVDQDEAALEAPVVSLSLGASAWFRLGGPTAKDPTTRMRLNSGDVVVLGGAARRYRHGIDRVIPNTSQLIPSPQRINVTLRRVTMP